MEYHARASAPRHAAIQSMNSRATVGPFPSHAIPPAVSCPFAVYSRSAYHHMSTRSSCRRHQYYGGRLVTEWPDWPLMSSHEKTRRVRRVHVVGACTKAVGRSTCEEVRPPPPLSTCMYGKVANSPVPAALQATICCHSCVLCLVFLRQVIDIHQESLMQVSHSTHRGTQPQNPSSWKARS